MNKPYKVKDPFFLKAKSHGYRARSAFKLLEINNKFKLFNKGQTVVDLGCAPGSFLQVISEFIGPDGKAIGVDLQITDPLDIGNVTLIQGDIFQTDALLKFFKEHSFNNVDVVTSDLAPSTSGIKDLDQGRSAELTGQAYSISTKILKPGGHFIGKIFQGEDMRLLLKEMKTHFRSVHVFTPQAVRNSSRETYVIALGFKPDTMQA